MYFVGYHTSFTKHIYTLYNILTINQGSMECEMKMICHWIVWYFLTCMFVQLHNYVWGRMLRRGCTGREQNNIAFCIRKSWQSFYQHVINKTNGSDNIDKCVCVLYIPLLDKEENIRPRVSDVWKTCAREIAEIFQDSGNVFRNRHAE